jgi:tol-pal system protein YbgF
MTDALSRLKIFLLLGGLGLSSAAFAQYPAPVETPQSPVEQLRQIVLEQSQQIHSLRVDVQRLVGDNELLQHKLEQIEKRQRDVYSDMDERLRRMESGQAGMAPAAAAAPPPEMNIPPPGGPAQTPPPATPPMEQAGMGGMPPVSSQPVSAPPVPPAAATPQDKAAYEQAFADLQGGRFNQAIAGFKKLLANSPQGQYADNAQYWLGECYYATRDFPTALQAFTQVIDNYPNSAKRSHALLKLGYVHYELNNKPLARQVLEQVSKTYPGTATARLAEERLQKMGPEGN